MIVYVYSTTRRNNFIELVFSILEIGKKRSNKKLMFSTRNLLYPVISAWRGTLNIAAGHIRKGFYEGAIFFSRLVPNALWLRNSSLGTQPRYSYYREITNTSLHLLTTHFIYCIKRLLGSRRSVFF